MKISLSQIKNDRTTNIATRCPHCGHFGTFTPVAGSDVRTYHNEHNRGEVTTNFLGIRRCPNERCHGHLFFIAGNNRDVLLTSPSETIPFDKENIPEKVLNAFEEAIKCHSNSCFIASAIMIRKTLEEICIDRGATGKNLYLKLQDLGGKILIPQELLAGMNELRLLGNDAAHIEAQTFSDIGKEEIEVSLEFAKEILKAVYQYDNLLKRLKKLKEKNNTVS
ncbi:DUF4145 domain-containing protein [Pontibacter amylolyticus]|uniref:DUF4145 domain-containing protein n=1 Tax=Pontibacter amylolyticus TaxID=1424080 RepID=A0ABQ1W449_9BACT|nr:DUF4145 domain-containing protein [Pontibacter amylolyticus]GGG12809.1 hypothetical protein GCM10011323_16540 [Pontibacter amylolyticus]